MRRLATAALLAAPLLLGLAGPAPGNNGPCTFGLGCGGTCLRLFPHIHQHGPLYNYGPYYGYPPFEPYGHWNSYLQYTGPVPDPVTGWGGGGGGQYGWVHGARPNTFGDGNPHPLVGGHRGGRGGVFHHGHQQSGGCSSCAAAAASYVNSGDAVARFNGVGTPAAAAAYYADSTVVTVGYVTGR